jgi:hypothetical protein
VVCWGIEEDVYDFVCYRTAIVGVDVLMDLALVVCICIVTVEARFRTEYLRQLSAGLWKPVG